MEKKLFPEFVALEESLEPTLYKRLLQKVNGGVVFEKVQSDTVLAVADVTLPFLKSTLVEIPKSLLKEGREWTVEQLKRWHEFSHPSLWKFDRVVEYEGKLYLQGPRIEGNPLSSFSSPLSTSEVIKFLFTSLSFLQTLHDSGSIMGCLNPSNIFIGDEVFFLDIGFSYLIAQKYHQPGMPLGIEWEYQPPEVFMTAQVSPAADICALGIMAWEAVQGHAFQKGSSISELMSWHRNFRPPSLSLGKKGLPPRLTEVIESMCNKSLHHRIDVGEALKIVRDLKEQHVREAPAPRAILSSKLSLRMQHTELEMVRLPAAAYIRGGGDPDGETDVEDLPPHKVILTKDFFISTHLITQELYQMVMGSNPSKFEHPRRPVESVSWLEAVLFCNELSHWHGFTPYYRVFGDNVDTLTVNNGFRLPTEAEWEYSARAGTDFKFSGSNRLGEVGHYEGNRRYFGCVEINQYRPNDWGIYDMSGNVMEWCFDGYDDYAPEDVIDPIGDPKENYKIVRGGSWNREASDARVRKRKWLTFAAKTDYLGFRVVREA